MSKVICIDAGHGGTDPGAVNGRYKESEATLGIANKIADKLKAKGHRVVLTRTKDPVSYTHLTLPTTHQV